MRRATIAAIRDRLATYDAVLEVGIGREHAVAVALAEAGVSVTAMDITPGDVPDSIRFVREDVTDPDLERYVEADGHTDGQARLAPTVAERPIAPEAVYGLNLPPELHHPTLDLATHIGVPFHFTTLGADQPAIPVERETLPGDTFYTAISKSA